MNNVASKKNNYIYTIIFTFSLMCFITLVIFKVMGMFGNITSSFLILESVFLLLLISNSLNYTKINFNKNKGITWLLATIFVGNIFYIAVIAFLLGRNFIRTLM